jgi:lysophospholipase
MQEILQNDIFRHDRRQKMTVSDSSNQKSAHLDTNKRLHFSCIPDEEYDREMRETVEPYLKARCQWGDLDGIYYEFYSRHEPHGTVVISYGFTESCAKYRELIYYMHREGYQVAILDHRGHGNSLREVSDSQLVHVEDFECYVEDLHRFIQEIVLPRTHECPLYLFAHSMGGCIGALYLEQHPDIFQKAVLSAPMLGINNGNVPDWAAALLCRTACLFGKKKKKLFTNGDFEPDAPFESAACNSPIRHAYYERLRRDNPKLWTTAATYGWAGQALKAAKRAIAPKNAAKINIPVLLFAATEDNFVRAREQDLFLERIPDGRKVLVESRHEITRHNSQILEAYLAEVFAFFR